MESKALDLKSYLMRDFGDRKHRHDSLIDIFISDHKYYLELNKENKIREDAVNFFHVYKKQILATESISVHAFRIMKCQLLIQDYLESQNQSKQDARKKKDPVHNANMVKKDLEKKSANKRADKVKESNNKRLTSWMFPTLVCPYDLEIMKCRATQKVSLTIGNRLNKFTMPLYKCKLCGRRYTALGHFNDMHRFALNDNIFVNLNDSRKGSIGRPKVNYAMLPSGVKKKCCVYGANRPKKCRVNSCGHVLIKKRICATKKHKHGFQNMLWCPSCGMLYVDPQYYKDHAEYFECVNAGEITVFEEERRKKREEKKRKKLEQKKRQQELEKQNAEIRKQKLIEQKKIEKQRLEIQRQKELEKLRLEEARKRQWQDAANRMMQEINNEEQHHPHDNIIRVKDFVVRRNVFKCMHDDHKLQNIDAVISVINRDGDIISVTVPAGYCPTCNIFFIMESTYEDLRMHGTPICRLSDERTYLRGSNYLNGMKLAQQSVLMQYGYSVSKQEGLTSARRHKILAVIIDCEILTKSEIISYLDFFISQKQYQSKFEAAISKWEEDRDFVSEYKKGSYTEFSVSGLYRHTYI